MSESTTKPTVERVVDMLTDDDGVYHDGNDWGLSFTADGNVVRIGITPSDEDGEDLAKVHFRAVVVEGEETPALLTGPLAEVARWRDEENARMGDLTPPDGTGDPHYRQVAEDAYRSAFEAFRDGEGTWVHVFAEAASKAFAESDPAKLRAQLVKVAAEAVCWVEAIDRRSAQAGPAESEAGR